ncbi:MAG: hypothetical protein WA869_08825 [Alloacidobacterium sp.]
MNPESNCRRRAEVNGRFVVRQRKSHLHGRRFTGVPADARRIRGAAEFEREMIRERRREGIAIAKAKGKHLGRAAILEPAQVKELRKRIAAGEDQAVVAKAFGISRASVYNYVA